MKVLKNVWVASPNLKLKNFSESLLNNLPSKHPLFLKVVRSKFIFLQCKKSFSHAARRGKILILPMVAFRKSEKKNI